MRNRARLALAGLVAALAWAGGALALPLDEVRARGELTVAVYRDFPPFSFRRDGELVGVDVELARMIAERLQLRLAIMELTAGETVDDDLRNGVWKGHYLERRVADVMLHVPTDRLLALRNKEAVIIAPYFRERVVVARDPDRIAADESITAFEREKVAVETDTLADIYLTSQLGREFLGNVRHFPTIARAVGALVDGEVAAVMGTEAEIAAALGDRRDRFPARPMPAPGLTKPWWELGLAVKDNSRDLGYALGDVIAELRRDGTIAGIFRRHGLPYLAPEE